MSEKRFTFYYERGNEVVIEDNGKRLSNKKVVDCLNEQQATINRLQTELELVSGAKLFSRKELERKVKEQQAILIKQEQKIKHLREVLTEIYVMSVQESIISEERSENDE